MAQQMSSCPLLSVNAQNCICVPGKYCDAAAAPARLVATSLVLLRYISNTPQHFAASTNPVQHPAVIDSLPCFSLTGWLRQKDLRSHQGPAEQLGPVPAAMGAGGRSHTHQARQQRVRDSKRVWPLDGSAPADSVSG
jgi:hypothetical protein